MGTFLRTMDVLGKYSKTYLVNEYSIGASIIINNNNNNFFCANILKNQAQWRDKTKGLSKLVIESNA